MIISDSGLDFIAGWESFRSRAYKDQAGIWTIGYGTIRYHSGTPVKRGDKISKPDATIYMLSECDGIASKLNIFLQVDVSQHQFDSLVSLAYNIGTYGLKTSTLLRELNRRHKIIENYFTRWNKITKDGKLVASAGLTRRRRSEWKMFSEADYTGNKG